MTNSPPSSVPPPVAAADRRQRNALIGLGVGSGLVLLIGIIAAVLTRDPGSATVPTTFSTVATTAAESTVPTSETITTTITTTTLPEPVDAVADAGPDLAVSSGGVVTLTAVGVTEGADDESVTWRQTSGPDVTAGVGALGGRSVSFGAPDDVVTLEFELVVTSGDRAATAPEAVDGLVVRVFDDAERMVFVDGDRGDDAGVGSMEAPLRTIGAAALAADGRDIYVRSVGTYVEASSVGLGAGTSLYGGFDADWKRDRTQRVRLSGAAVALIVDGDVDRTIGSIELTAADAVAGGRSIAIRIVDGETVTVADSRILAGAGGAGTDEADAGVSVGIVVVRTGELRVERSTVTASGGGDGADGVSPDADGSAAAGADGDDGDGRDAGDGAAGDGIRRGGDGGRGGLTSDGTDAPGADGGDGGTADDRDGRPGGGGAGGAGGVGGDGGQELLGDDTRTPIGATGSAGAAGEPGEGGSGGGGGFGPLLVRGGGGGGGGAGADESGGGAPGRGGAGSVGVWAVDVDRVVINESLVAAGRGGRGGRGSAAELGGPGGSGGGGARGAAGVLVGDGGNGGGAGGGGAGGAGGHGGGGAGGPSYGMLTSGVDDVEVRTSTVRGGAGGSGADGGFGGAAGGRGSDGSGRDGGVGGAASAGNPSAQGVGASGGSSLGWFDVDGARQTLDEALFIEGNAGTGGAGSSAGDDGVQTSANVDAE